jgi:hypothetical protein
MTWRSKKMHSELNIIQDCLKSSLEDLAIVDFPEEAEQLEQALEFVRKLKEGTVIVRQISDVYEEVIDFNMSGGGNEFELTEEEAERILRYAIFNSQEEYENTINDNIKKIYDSRDE